MITLESVSVCPACSDILRRGSVYDRVSEIDEWAPACYPHHLREPAGKAIALLYLLEMASNLLRGEAMRQAQAIMYADLAHVLLDLAVTGPWQLTRSERLLLQNALVARNAAIDGDHDTVDEFSRTWLGLEHPARWRAAVEMALLGDWVDALHDRAVDDPALRHLLRREADEAHHQMLPLWEHRTRSQRVTLLSRPVGDGLTLADVVTDRRCPESLLVDDEFQDPRVGAVLRQLAEPEEKVARTWAAGADSWAVAAVDSAQPAAYGERVRRKLHRLGARQTERAAAAVTR
ncbi:hypothetical protein ABT024_10860 [Streptomyces sp. NPDC002812]|uniref:hypothetical protein n=1 Tax=Streptomyces sp. NPDC002812 TaxID=3154434 RepID=UPI00331BD519